MPKRADQPTDDPTLGSFAPADNPPKPFPDEDWAWFVAGCDSLGIPDAPARRGILEALYGHLLGVNRWLNLTTITAPRDYLKLHILDSLALLGDSRLKHLAAGSPCVDLGSGGGYPGLPLAAWTPGVPWVLIDARRKKADFLAVATTLTGNTAASARHLRGGEVSNRVHDLWRRCQLVTCRAMGQTADVLAEAADLVRPNGHVVVYKGPAFAGDERSAAEAAAKSLGYRLIAERGVILDEGDPERVMLVYQRDR